MATVGTRTKVQPGKGYERNEMRAYASAFMDTAKAVVRESSCDFFGDPRGTFASADARGTMKNFFMENAFDADFYQRVGDPEGLQEQIQDLEALYENDMEAVHEYAAMASFNPVLGLTFPIHKYILMNCMFDKVIPHAVALSPRFTLDIETRILIDPEGNEYDMFKQQDMMHKVMKSVNPFVYIEIPATDLPSYGTEGIDVLARPEFDELGENIRIEDENLSVETQISHVKATVTLKTGDINPETGAVVTTDGDYDVWVPHNGTFSPGYGDFDRIMMSKVVIPTRDASGNMVAKTDVISGIMKKNRLTFTVASAGAVVTAIRIAAKIDPSRATLPTCSVSWRVRSDYFEIPNAVGINVPISPEEIKDINALYQVNQLTKIMSLINTVLGNNKDDDVREQLDDSFRILPDDQKFSGVFDFAPREGYYSDHIQWRRDTFMDALDTYVQQMVQVWNDPNIEVSVVGRAELIRKLTPAEYTYQSPANLGPVDLDYVTTVVTKDRRMYTFMSCDKMRNNNNLIVLLKPRNSDRIMYKLFDYQAYVSNEIRNAKNPSLPAVHAFERYKFLAYQPVQSRIRIINPTGLRDVVTNRDPINPEVGGTRNDFTANLPESVLAPTTP